MVYMPHFSPKLADRPGQGNPHILCNHRPPDGGFEPDADYWTMVRIEQIRQREKENIALVIKHMQEVVGLKGGMNGDGAELSGDVKVEVENLLREGGWVA